jgi:hypothetical protein
MVRRLTMEADTIARTAAHCGMAAGGGTTLGRDGRAPLCATYEEKKVGGVRRERPTPEKTAVTTAYGGRRR